MTTKAEKLDEVKTPIDFLPEVEEKEDNLSEKEVEDSNEINLKPASIKNNKNNT